MRVLICWSHISGYMAACWRRLAARPGVDLFVLARASGGKAAHTSFDEGIMQGVPCRLLPSDGPIDPAVARAVAAEHKPDIIVLNGWHTPAYVALPSAPEAASARFIMAMDTPYLGTIRQRLGGLVYRRFFSRMDRVFVTGERCWQLARVLGFRERVIRRGVYGVDFDQLEPIHARRAASPGGWPRRFLYTGRYVPVKAIDVMLEGYAIYRRRVPDPWPLTCCGQGPMADLIRAAEGVEDRGFVQPHDMPEVWAEHGAFVLASRFDPWPLVVVEACAAGLPIICTESCGSRVELVRFCYNGIACETGNAESLADSLLYIHRNHHRLPEMGRASQEMARPYSADMWVERWTTVFDELTARRATPPPDQRREP